MTHIEIILISCICILGLIMIIKIYFLIYKLLRRKKVCKINKIQEDEKIKQILEILKESDNLEKKAHAFVDLISLSYVLVHTIVNHGNNYDDLRQNRKFKKSLTPEVIKRINAVEGKNE